ncbi:MAG: hypothetical protein ABWK53_08340 [Anaerolineales bacterium]
MGSLKARLVTLLSISMAAAMLLMILYWAATDSLEDRETIFIALGLILLLGGLTLLARRGRPHLAAGLLTGLLFLLILAASVGYGVGTPSTAGFLLPIVLAAAALGPAACWLVTGLSLAAVWITALAAAQAWYAPWIPYQTSDLTFTAPFYTFLFLLTAVILTTARLRAE